MYTPSAHELLCAWERGCSRPAAMRAVALLEAFHPDVDTATLARLSVGRRDARLLDLRAAAFGNRAACIADCQQCGERLDLEVDLDTLRQPLPELDDSARGCTYLTADGWQIRFRVPNSLDLTAASTATDAGAAKRLLLSRCIETAIGPQQEEVDAADLPESIVAAISARMSDADPQADVQLALACPKCGKESSVVFDIASFLWEELQAFVRRIMRDVHDLARAYGWREAEILNMTAQRRGIYLEMLGK